MTIRTRQIRKIASTPEQRFYITKTQFRKLHSYVNYCLDVSAGNINPFRKNGLEEKSNTILSMLDIDIYENQEMAP